SRPRACRSLYTSDARRDLHSFPTRRSSDLRGRWENRCPRYPCRQAAETVGRQSRGSGRSCPGSRARPASFAAGQPARRIRQRERSEEHTSELQSRENLVCRLLLEKKKKTAI